jgi:hypothetical protein
MRFYRWRFLRLALFLLLLASTLVSYIYLSVRPSYALYDKLFSIEQEATADLIQDPKSHGARYVFFRQLQGAGFNNQVQEILLYHHLALSSSRIYVYQPLVWRSRGESSLAPLSAFLKGPTDNTAISSVLFDHVCPPEERTHVLLRADGASSQSLWDHSVSVLQGSARCVVVDDWIFNWNYLASPALHVVWQSFQQYLSVHFKWSSYIRDIAQRTYDKLSLRPTHLTTSGDRYLALHFRRGDFENHCHILAANRVGFTTWATLPQLQKSVLPPQLNSSEYDSVVEHCYPSMERVISAVTIQLERHPRITTVHILHDGAWDHPTVYYHVYRLANALKALSRGGRITRVTNSRLIPLEWGEADWTVSVDVEIARRADAFVGNGFSSLSTQVIALRLGADGGKTEDVTLF